MDYLEVSVTDDELEDLFDGIEPDDYDEYDDRVVYLEDLADDNDDEFDPWAERGLAWDDI